MSYFKCNQCNSDFEYKKGPECHIGKNSEEPEVTIQLDQTIDELVHRLYHKPPASVIFTVRGRTFYHDTEPDRIYSVKFGDDKVYECY